MSCEICVESKIIMHEEVGYFSDFGYIAEGDYVDEGVVNVVFDARGYLRLVSDD